jgi:cysteine-rich repeat protein
VNGQRLTSFPGRYDDGVASNGALITIGDYNDSNANPVDPNPYGNAPDDELYSLTPFLTAGDTSIVVNTRKPSNDDNIFFAGIFSTIPSSTAEFCGDGNLDLGEQCDDGNKVAGDGCSAIRQSVQSSQLLPRL